MMSHKELRVTYLASASTSSDVSIYWCILYVIIIITSRSLPIDQLNVGKDLLNKHHINRCLIELFISITH